MVGGMKGRERKKDRGIGEGRVRDWRIAGVGIVGEGRRAGKEERLGEEEGPEEGRRVEEGGE